MGKAEVGTPKWIANKIKSKGLQKLRWYCQMCQKQCRDENGFKCHTMSESHQRQLLIFADQPNQFLNDFSKEFEDGYMNLLKRCHGTKRVFANAVYQDYIKDKDHVHMNSTRWETLTGFVQFLGRTGKCVVDQTEKGWYVTWIDRDPETIARQEALQKKDKMEKDDEERLAEFIRKQVERSKDQDGAAESRSEFTELRRGEEDDKVSLNLTVNKMSERPSSSGSRIVGKDPFKVPKASSKDRRRPEIAGGTDGKRKKSALEEIMEEELEKKKVHKKGAAEEKRWIKRGIVVKVMAKSLGDKYYKQKGYVKEVVGRDRMAAIVVLLSGTAAKVKVDQAQLETVIPAIGRRVMILSGARRGEEAILKELDIAKFSAKLCLERGGGEDVIISLPYEDFSKIHEEK